MKKIIAILMACLFALSFTTALAESENALSIVCTTFPQYDWVRQILGDRADDVDLTLLLDNGWTWLTALNVMLFSLFHWPCSTTLLTIRRETKSWKWTAVSFLLPTLAGILLCMLTNGLVSLVSLAGLA